MSDESSGSPQRYELEELFPKEEDYTVDFLKIVGSMIVILLLLAALVYPFLVGGGGTGAAGH